MSNLPTRTLKRLVYETAVGSDLYVLYKGTLLYRHWANLYGIPAATEMHTWWVKAWESYPTLDHSLPDQLELLSPAEE